MTKNLHTLVESYFQFLVAHGEYYYYINLKRQAFSSSSNLLHLFPRYYCHSVIKFLIQPYQKCNRVHMLI